MGGRILVRTFTFLTFCQITPALAGDSIACSTSPRWSQWTKSCAEESKKLKRTGISSILRQAQCSESYYLTKGESTRCRYYSMSYEQLHIMVAEAFYAKRKDHRQQAMGTLMYYRCEDTSKCKEFRRLLDGEIKENVLSWRKTAPRLLRMAEKMRGKIKQPSQQ